MATCYTCGGFGSKAALAPCDLCGGSGQDAQGGPCAGCRGARRVSAPRPCPTCAGRGTLPDPPAVRPSANSPGPKRAAPSGDKLWRASEFPLGWMARLPRWIVWPLCGASGVACAIWVARQPDVLPGVVALTGFMGLFVPMLAYAALRYAVGISIRLTLGALQLAVVLFVIYVALVAAGLVTPIGK